MTSPDPPEIPVVPGRLPAESYTLATIFPPPPPRQRNPLLWPLVITLVVSVLVAGGGFAVWRLFLVDSGSAPVAAATSPPAITTPPPKPTTPTASLMVHGVIDLIDPGEHWKAGKPCHGSGGFADIHGGAQVVITGRSGQTVGVADLFDGNGNKRSGYKSVVCTFAFVVLVVPGEGFYGIEVSHRGVIQEAEADLEELVGLTLGDEG